MRFFFLSFIFFTTSYTFPQNLPNYLTEEEKELYKTYQPPSIITDYVNPPAGEVRTMAEWEEVQGIIITWTSYTSILRQIIDYAQEEGVVYVVCSDSNTVKNYLTSGGVPLVNLKFIIASFNSVWCRDYGPWAVYSGISDSLKLVDWIYNRPRPLDDQVPVSFSNFINIPLYQAIQSPNNLTATGGNFMVDGNGTGFSSKLILNENSSKTESQIDSIMNKFMGIKRYIKMSTLPYDQIHHIDMHIKLLDEETLLVGQYPVGTADGPQIESNLQYVINNFQTCYGRQYKVIRIPMPPSNSGQYPPASNYYTYTNSVFINKTVLVPIYGLSMDTTALRIYRENLPGYRIYGINCNGMISALGAIHCITKEIGVNEPIFFSHPKISDTINSSSPVEIISYIKTKSGISNSALFWTKDTLQGFSQINMQQISQDTFKASIPAQLSGTKIYYYISANSNSGKTVSKPLTAPSGNYRFRILYESPHAKITVIPEGLFLNNLLARKDTISIYLHDAVSPYTLRDSCKRAIDTINYSSEFIFSNIASGKYYLDIRHFNSIQTWSRTGGDSLNGDDTLNYNFITSSAQAYGDNMKLINGKYCIYSGDVDQNGIIDVSDLIPIFSSSVIPAAGNYLKEDLNGDLIVDVNDIAICYNNSLNLTVAVTP